MTKLIIARNGATDWNKINRVQGSVDVPLNTEGRAEAERIASELNRFKLDVIYSSCLSRSYETAEIIARKRDLRIKRLKELNELNQGVWQGLRVEEIKKRYKKQYGLWRSSPFSTKPPQGESIKEAYDRVVNAVQKIVDRYKNEIVCIVTHEIVISLIKCHFTSQDINKMWDIIPTIASWEKINV